MRTRKFWGWGYEDELLTDEEENNIDRRIASTFNLDSVNCLVFLFLKLAIIIIISLQDFKDFGTT